MGTLRKVHFIGIGGVGMSAVARVLLDYGIDVSGSDVSDGAVLEDLRKHGAHVFVGHTPENVDGATEVVLSSAISPENPELLFAKQRGLAIRHRSDVLAELMEMKDGIAIAGAHGKTTITSMVSWVLYYAGLSPTFLIGGVIPGLGGAQAGNGRWIVAEADESDGSFTAYKPRLAVVTGIEADHLENFNHDENALKESYAQFMRRVQPGGKLIVCVDDDETIELARKVIKDREIITYGFSSKARYRAYGLSHSGFKTTFMLEVGGEPIGDFSVSVPGIHNVQNALATIAVARETGIGYDRIRRELATFKGARRRFEVVSGDSERMIVSDYAHHPSEIEATIEAAKKGWNRKIIAVFQPHRYSRTARLIDAFAASFDMADQVVITDIYAPPPEQPIDGVSGEKLAQMISDRSNESKALYVPTLGEAIETVDELARPGDMVIVMGAGDVWKVAHSLAERDGLKPDAV